jgi:hypothetical protein
MKLLKKSRETTGQIIDDLYSQHSQLHKNKPRYDRGGERAAFLNVIKQKKQQRRKIKAAICRQLDNLQRDHNTIDALITSGTMLSGLEIIGTSFL